MEEDGDERVKDQSAIARWESFEISGLRPCNIRRLTPETEAYLANPLHLFTTTRHYQSYSDNMYPELPHVMGPYLVPAPNAYPLMPPRAFAQLASLLNLPPGVLLPRRRIDVCKELGMDLASRRTVLVADSTAYNPEDPAYSHYEEAVKKKRQSSEINEEDSAQQPRPRKRAKLCTVARPQFLKSYASIYNAELVEFLTGISGPSQLQPSMVSAAESAPVTSASYGTLWTSEEKEKFFVFLGRRSRHDMAGIAEAIGTKTALECEIYHNLLFREAQKLRGSSIEGNLNSISMEDIPAAAEMSQPWIEIEQAQAQALDNWTNHLESGCLEHTKNSNEKTVYYNPQVSVMSPRKTGVLIDLQDNPFKSDPPLYGETEEFFDSQDPPFDSYFDDPVNKVVRASSAMTMAHEFWNMPLGDSLSRDFAERGQLQYIEDETLDELNEIVIDYTRNLVRAIYGRMMVMLASKPRYQKQNLIVTRSMVLSMLQELDFTLPRHTLLNSILARENVDVVTSVRNKTIEKFCKFIYNPFYTSWHSNLLLNRRDYQSAYSLLREKVHESLQQPLESNTVDDSRSVIDFESAGEESEDEKPLKADQFRDWNEDREYLSDELLDYSAHALGSKMRKKIMIRAIPPPRSLDEFTENDIRDMIDTVRALEEKKITHSALLERTLLAQNCGRMPGENDSDTEAHSTDESEPETEEAEEELENFRVPVGCDAEGNLLSIGLEGLLAYEERVLNSLDQPVSAQEEERLVHELETEEPRVREVYRKLEEWFSLDSTERIVEAAHELMQQSEYADGDVTDCSYKGRRSAGRLEREKMDQVLSTHWDFDEELLRGVDAEYLFEARLLATQIMYVHAMERPRLVKQLQEKLERKAGMANAAKTRMDHLEDVTKELALCLAPMTEVESGDSSGDEQEGDAETRGDTEETASERKNKKRWIVARMLATEYLSAAHRGLARMFPEQGGLGI